MDRFVQMGPAAAPFDPVRIIDAMLGVMDSSPPEKADQVADDVGRLIMDRDHPAPGGSTGARLSGRSWIKRVPVRLLVHAAQPAVRPHWSGHRRENLPIPGLIRSAVGENRDRQLPSSDRWHRRVSIRAARAGLAGVKECSK
ncbi:hypothetical protein ACFZBE_18235 [Streptomyces sp. NPDC008061]|uniref:hypothetical protein n=1 Tax=Streptomyces sp. NPDC008061 TaxID=3364805 RepID=UPI0036E0178A